jgi:hypothetical protein
MNYSPSDHHPLGPSNFPAWSQCADYEPTPDDPEDMDVEDDSPRGRGTVKHKAVAMLLAGDLAMRQRALEGLSEREIEEVQFVVRRAIEIVESHGYSASDLKVEQRVTMMKPDSFEPLYFGTCDGEAGPLDFDWKFGLDRHYFSQLAGYSLPKMEARGEQRRHAYVIYGRLKRHEHYVITRDTAESVVYGTLSRRLSEHRKPTPCEYCGFCAKRAVCSALVSTPVNLVARREDWALKLPSPHVSQLRDPAWLGAARFVWKMYLEPWGKAVEFASSSIAAAGMAPVGFKRRVDKGWTTVSDVRKAFAALKDVLIGTIAKAYAANAGISEEKAKTIIVTKLADAKALQVGEPSVKLVREKNAEELIRAALIRPVPALPEKGVDPKKAYDTDRSAPDGAGV